MSNWRRAVIGSVALFIAVNVVLSLVALFDRLPDLPHTHATTDRIGVGTILWGGGSIISPPLVFMVVLALLLGGVVLAKRRWVRRASAVLILAATAVMAIDEYSGDGGLKRRPALYSQSKWDLALTLGWVFIVAAAAVVVSALGWLATSAVGVRAPRTAGG